MNNDLISRSELKKVFGYTDEWYKGRTVCAIIDNAPTVPLPDFKEGYKQAILDGKTNFPRQQEDILDVIHNTIYGFMDLRYEEEPMSDKDKLLLEVNKAICNRLRRKKNEKEC